MLILKVVVERHMMEEVTFVELLAQQDSICTGWREGGRGGREEVKGDKIDFELTHVIITHMHAVDDKVKTSLVSKSMSKTSELDWTSSSCIRRWANTHICIPFFEATR